MRGHHYISRAVFDAFGLKLEARIQARQNKNDEVAGSSKLGSEHQLSTYRNCYPPVSESEARNFLWKGSEVPRELRERCDIAVEEATLTPDEFNLFENITRKLFPS